MHLPVVLPKESVTAPKASATVEQLREHPAVHDIMTQVPYQDYAALLSTKIVAKDQRGVVAEQQVPPSCQRTRYDSTLRRGSTECAPAPGAVC